MKNKGFLLAGAGIALAVLLLVMGCGLEVNDPVRNIPIVSAYITGQPQSASYNLDDTDYVGYSPLTVSVRNWIDLDGTISYQWYTFESIEDYCENGGGTPIPGATRSSYTPEIDDYGSVGLSYFYYVIVSNNFEHGTDKTKDSIQSDIAIISFYDRTTLPLPVITRHPANAKYTIGRAAAVSPLEVRATGGTTLTYQWFKNETFSIIGGVEIENADTSSYMPDIDALAKGEHYFYVVITNTEGTGSAARSVTVTTLPVIITMVPGEKAANPRITLQPLDRMILTPLDPDFDQTLKVRAESTDNGQISIQWYRVDMAAEKGNFNIGEGSRQYVLAPTKVSDLEKVEGATEEDFMPTISSGVAYYQAEITNTNNDVQDQTKTTAVVRSKIVTVRFSASGNKSANAWIQIPSDYNTFGSPNRRQYVRGYGGMDVAWANFPNTTEGETRLQYNPDWGLGFNILRIMIVPPGSQQGNYTNHEDLVMGRLPPPGTDPSTFDNQGWNGLINGGQRPDYINNVKVVNEYNGYVLASPWTPPKEWKTNNSINSGGTLMESNYVSFANYLRSFCQYMYYQGAPVYAVSIANEPNYSGGYDGCEWDDGKASGPFHMRSFFLKVGQFTQGVRGYGGGKSIPRVLIVNGESANTPRINDSVLDNAATRGAVDFYARHVYGSQLETLWQNKNGNASFRENSPYLTECWMTEHNINSANALSFPNDYTWNYIWRFMNDVDLVIRLNDESAFVWWASKRFYSFIGDGQYKNYEGHVLPRGYGLSHYAKYSKETTRINFDMWGTITLSNGTQTGINTQNTATSTVNRRPAGPTADSFSLDALDPKITAFVSPDGNEISFVMFTPTLPDGSAGSTVGTIEIRMPDYDRADGFKIGSVNAVRSTSASDIMTPPTFDNTGSSGDYLTVAGDRKSACVTLGSSQIISVKFTKE